MAHPKEGKRFYLQVVYASQLRLLLTHVLSATSFENLLFHQVISHLTPRTD